MMSPVDTGSPRGDIDQAKPRAGRLFIVSAPSGAGKTTLCNAIRKHFTDLSYSISYTTRSARKYEQDGRDYFFISEQEFKQGITGNRWAEWARVHDHFYGTSARWITQALSQGRDVLMDIDVQGTRSMLRWFPDAVTIFIVPPSLEELKRRLEARAADDAASIALRLANAHEEMAQKELYRHIVVNDNLQSATREIINLLNRYRNM